MYKISLSRQVSLDKLEFTENSYIKTDTRHLQKYIYKNVNLRE